LRQLARVIEAYFKTAFETKKIESFLKEKQKTNFKNQDIEK
jgi:hypothetical protein